MVLTQTEIDQLNWNEKVLYYLNEIVTTGTGSLVSKGVITVAADFPTAAAVQAGWLYFVLANVTDNDPTKTNTGQSFITGDEIVWTGSAWASLGATAMWADSGTDLIPVINGRNINVRNGGFKDTNVTTAIKLGDALNTSFTTTNKTIVGAVNEIDAKIIAESLWDRNVALTYLYPQNAGDSVLLGDDASLYLSTSRASYIKAFGSGSVGIVCAGPIDFFADSTATPTITMHTANSAVSATGPLNIYSGYSTGTTSGAIQVHSGNANGAGADSGDVSVFSGPAQDISGNVSLYSGGVNDTGSGLISITSGAAANGGTGGINIETGNGRLGSGNVTILTGYSANGASGYINLTTASSGNATGHIYLTTGTSGLGGGDIKLEATGELQLKDKYLTSTIALSQTGTTGLVGYTATSIVGALNEAKSVAGKTTYTAVVDAAGLGDYTTIGAAITAYPTGTIFVRNGSYNETKQLLAANSGLRILGESRDGVIWNYAGPVITLSTGHVVTDIAIENLTISTSGGAGAIIITNGDTYRWYISRVKCDGTGNTQRLVWSGGGTHKYWVLTDCEFANYTYAAFSLYGTAVTDWTITKCYFHDNPSFPGGVDTFNGCARLNLSYNVFYNVFEAIFTNGGGNTGHNVSFNVLYNCTRGVSFFSPSTYCVANGNTIQNSNTNGLWAVGTTGSSFVGNSVSSVPGVGIEVNGALDTLVSSNMNRGNGTDMAHVGDVGTISIGNYAN